MGDPVVHFEINGPDIEMLEKFYSELFGWRTSPMPEMGYTTVDTAAGSGINGGFGKMDTPFSSVVIEVGDLQGMLDRAGALGGPTTTPVVEVPGVITFAQFADPAGNRIGLVKSAQTDAPGVSAGSNPPLAWFEIYGKEPAALWQFYTELFGWKIKELPGVNAVYGEIDTGAGRGINGGITANPVGSPGVILYTEAEDLQGYLDRAISLGGAEVMPVTSVVGDVTFAIFSDPQGTMTGVFKQK